MKNIKNYECKYCHQHFLTTRGSFSNHIAWCKYNPKYEENVRRKNERLLKIKEKNEKKYKDVTLNCLKCGKEYTIKVHENDLKAGRYRKYCSRSCANSHIIDDNTKKKIGEGVKNSEKYKEGQRLKRERYWEKYPNGIHKDPSAKSSKKDLTKKYICGTKELNEQHQDISCRQSPKWFKKLIPFGFDITSLYTERIINEHDKVKELLYNEYVINEMSPGKIYKKYNCENYIKHPETLLHIFKNWNFPTRSHSKAVINAWIQGDITSPINPNQYNCGWYKTWKGDEVYLRSSFEKEYAKYLDNNKIEYEVESLRIKYYDSIKKEYRCSIPDFYIPSTKNIIEIKSSWTLDVQNLKDKFDAYVKLGYIPRLILNHKEVDLYTLNQDDYNSKFQYDTMVKNNVKISKEKFHTMWISNDKDKQSIKIKIEDFDIYKNKGWYKGRKMRWN